jgi:hypothetical protein
MPGVGLFAVLSGTLQPYPQPVAAAGTAVQLAADIICCLPDPRKGAILEPKAAGKLRASITHLQDPLEHGGGNGGGTFSLRPNGAAS